MARWIGPPRVIEKRKLPQAIPKPQPSEGRVRDLGHVDLRPLSAYESLAYGTDPADYAGLTDLAGPADTAAVVDLVEAGQ